MDERRESGQSGDDAQGNARQGVMMADHDEIHDDVIERELEHSAREASNACAGFDLTRAAEQLRRIGPVPGAVSPRYRPIR